MPCLISNAMMNIFVSSLVLFSTYFILSFFLSAKFKYIPKQTSRTISACIIYFIFDIILIFAYLNPPINLLHISSFNIRILLICIINCYSGGFVFEPKFKNIYHNNKLFMVLFLNNIIIMFCNNFISNSFMLYINVTFAIIQTILSLLLLHSIKE